MLHLLIHSPFKCDFNALLRMLAGGDDVLLLQDGVLAALVESHSLNCLLEKDISLHVLREDVVARGLSAQISPKAGMVSYTDFVALTVKHPKQMTW
ncbi:sulfurtransferase complex subunit TusB [Erwinia psidii]|uniref:Protein TusB n=1 Tax=Erwinia psidii TaxID=69224 RepID=A0A3N6TRG2_9GAMM|nr:sulfurtransferase complex subunit TusB [Erwinia psidii]MCX8958907.1 sulfurtransferase complex subunit TusB [Erwinia psidii]MCX8961979.1 sulfurtransferase complex subunit TusB [Erwinia psidii]MCX8966244.1 sulfurtransferase complex subunit TusB [Erwinia psidii]RQM37832.1 sulfurtransferase complex subunit TusB [Erwinia psidii]